jgi:hypothetical protein
MRDDGQNLGTPALLQSQYVSANLRTPRYARIKMRVGDAIAKFREAILQVAVDCRDSRLPKTRFGNCFTNSSVWASALEALKDSGIRSGTRSGSRLENSNGATSHANSTNMKTPSTVFVCLESIAAP